MYVTINKMTPSAKSCHLWPNKYSIQVKCYVPLPLLLEATEFLTDVPNSCSSIESDHEDLVPDAVGIKPCSMSSSVDMDCI